jgi:uncharacterized protein YjbI with pentapeptide repeats
VWSGMRSRVALVSAVVLLAAVATVAAAPSAGADVVIDGCTIVSSPTASTHTVCPSTNFTNAYLHGLDLSYADLDHANFTNANLTNTTLVSADLTGATNLAQLSGTNAENATFAGDVFGSSACLCGDFTNAHLSGIKIDATAVSGTTDLLGTFDGADLSGSLINPGYIDSGTFLGTNFHGASFGDSIHWPLVTLDFTGADLSNTHIETGTALQNLNLTNTNFDGAWIQADFANATITGSTWSGSVMVPGDQTAQATGPSGAIVKWAPPFGPSGLITGLTSSCDHNSGDLFPLGITTANCTVTSTDTATTGTATFAVNVVHDVTIDGCLIVWQPTVSHHTSCSGKALSNIDLHVFDLEYADFSGANLTKANFASTDLEHANLTNANLTSANIGTNPYNLNGADLQYSTLTGVNFTNALLSNANFSYSTLGINDRSYRSPDGPAGIRMALSWKAPAGYSSVTDMRPYGCTPSTGSLFPVGTTQVLCHVAHITNNTGALGFFTFNESVLPTVQPGSGTVTAPSSGTSDLQVAVTLNTPATATITVPWTTLVAGGNPNFYGAPQAPASDYTASSGTVTFLAGQSSAVVHIPVSADSTPGPGPEFVLVSFQVPTGAYLGGYWGLGIGLIYSS